MANTPSARKRVRQIARRTATNKARISRIRTFTKKVEVALAAGDAAAARAALQHAEPEIARGVTKGVLHKNTASRRISRLTQRVKKLQADA
jgi:small subunit ribosomal protein S20